MKEDIVTIILLVIVVLSLISMMNKISRKVCNEIIEERSYIMLEAKDVAIPNKVYYNIDVGLGVYDLAFKIIECESQWNDKAKNPASSAYGLGQFLNQTWDYIQNKWNIELERDNPEDQMYALVRLLEEEGPRHWESSRQCWDK